MFAKAINRLRCHLGYHRRSRGHARLSNDFYVSRCSHCGVPMRQTGENHWEVDTGQPYARNSGRFLDVD